MSHLLQRLAEHATGATKSGVRASARVRAAEPLGIGFEVSAAEPFGTAFETSATEPLSRASETSASEASPLEPGADAERRREDRAWTFEPREPSGSLLGLPERVPVPSRVESGEAKSRWLPRGARDAASPVESSATATLLGLEPAPASEPAHGPTRVTTPAPEARDLEPTEVHVHIGRIEITAESAQPPVRPQSPAPRTALSLADYLAKRQRRVL